MEYPKTPQGRVRRVANRAHYDHKTVHAVLDDGFLAQVAFSVEGRPFVIPMLYARQAQHLFLHASTKSRFFRELSAGIPVCVGVTHVDGLVLARSAFHHSVNYRSVVAHGHCRPAKEEEKETALTLFTNHLLAGRWEECRPVTAKELAVTGVLVFEMETAAAKIRTGGPKDDEADYDLPIWAGTLPIQTAYLPPITDPNSRMELELPESVRRVVNEQ